MLTSYEHVFHRGQPSEDPGKLERPAHATVENPIRKEVRDVLPVQPYRPLAHFRVTGDHIEQCGLPGTIRADEARNLTPANDQVATVERLDPAIALIDTFHFEHCHRKPPP